MSSSVSDEKHAVRRPRVLAISSGGGHWVELMRLRPAFADCHVEYATVHAMYAEEVPDAKFHVIPDATRWNKLALLLLAMRVVWVVLSSRANVVISTGAAPGYFALRIAKLLGKRTIWVDSFANVEELSMSGQMAGRYADLWLTQWPALARDGGPIFAGRVI